MGDKKRNKFAFSIQIYHTDNQDIALLLNLTTIFNMVMTFAKIQQLITKQIGGLFNNKRHIGAIAKNQVFTSTQKLYCKYPKGKHH